MTNNDPYFIDPMRVRREAELVRARAIKDAFARIGERLRGRKV